MLTSSFRRSPMATHFFRVPVGKPASVGLAAAVWIDLLGACTSSCWEDLTFFLFKGHKLCNGVCLHGIKVRSVLRGLLKKLRQLIIHVMMSASVLITLPLRDTCHFKSYRCNVFLCVVDPQRQIFRPSSLYRRLYGMLLYFIVLRGDAESAPGFFSKFIVWDKRPLSKTSSARSSRRCFGNFSWGAKGRKKIGLSFRASFFERSTYLCNRK